MKFDIDRGYLLDTFRTIVETGHTVTFDNRSTAYITLEGEDNTKTVRIGAHADTLGMCVRCIEGDGAIARVFTMLRYLHEHGLKPKYRTLLAFPYNEEISMGGTCVPPEAIDRFVTAFGKK